jgi:hypothetical protein
VLHTLTGAEEIGATVLGAALGPLEGDVVVAALTGATVFHTLIGAGVLHILTGADEIGAAVLGATLGS